MTSGRKRRERPATMFVGGGRSVLEAIRSGLAREVVVSGSARGPRIGRVVEAAGAAGIPTRTADARELDRLAPDHQGAIARVVLPPDLSERDLGEREFGPADLVVALDGVTDPQNLGAAARSAEAAGAVMLVTRQRRSAGVTSAAVRASAGALLYLPHARVANIPRALRRLQDGGFRVVGLDAAAGRTILDDPCPSGRVALVVGSESEGISRLVRETCDELVALPMRGRVASLNASAALAAALFGYVLPSRPNLRR